ncbi:hypothetical protein BGZ83_000931 [Gryganskiella cystojenkinii]|nr:hypothetical protein BGZ83_000931 [Gryganskiella cystojenkinii]
MMSPPKDLDLRKANEFFEEECLRPCKKAVMKHGNDKTPPRGTMAAMTRKLEIFHEREEGSILLLQLQSQWMTRTTSLVPTKACHERSHPINTEPHSQGIQCSITVVGPRARNTNRNPDGAVLDWTWGRAHRQSPQGNKKKKKKEAVESAVDQNETEKAYRNRVKSDIKGLITKDLIQYLAARFSKIQTADSGHSELTDDGTGIEAGLSTKKQQITLGVKKNMPSQSVQFDVDDDAGIHDSLTPTGSKLDRGLAHPIAQDNVSTRHPLWDKVFEKVQITADVLIQPALMVWLGHGTSSFLKEAIVRYLLRVTLRPLGEQAYKDMIHTKAEEKQQLAASKKTKPAEVLKALR